MTPERKQVPGVAGSGRISRLRRGPLQYSGLGRVSRLRWGAVQYLGRLLGVVMGLQCFGLPRVFERRGQTQQHIYKTRESDRVPEFNGSQ